MVRPVVGAFAHAMEARLAANDHKGGWQGEDVFWLLGRIRSERMELVDAVGMLIAGKTTPEAVLREAADVANFAMMVADVCGALGSEESANELV